MIILFNDYELRYEAVRLLNKFLIYETINMYDNFNDLLTGMKILSNFENFQCQNNGNLKNRRFSAKVEKGPYRVIRTGYISLSGCIKASRYQLP